MKDRDQHDLALERWDAATEDVIAAWVRFKIAIAECAILLAKFKSEYNDLAADKEDV